MKVKKQPFHYDLVSQYLIMRVYIFVVNFVIELFILILSYMPTNFVR